MALFFLCQQEPDWLRKNSEKDLDIKKNSEYFLIQTRITVILS